MGQEFLLDLEKIKSSIMSAAADAGLSNDEASNIADEVSNLVSPIF